ncbi:MAG: hypothetical protein HZA91_03655 [Verrucomicrobia bacterium]|nr:hypothetical protein [Verrucomicrobiota bacterium]
MKYIATFLCGFSAILFLSAYTYAKVIVQGIPAYEFQGGHGFALNAPIWGCGIIGLIIGIGGLIVLCVAVFTGRTGWYKSPAIVCSFLFLIPFFKACWIVARVVFSF